MISALVVVLVTFALASASPLTERQSGCNPGAIPQQCVQATTDYQTRFAQILANPSSMTPQQIREILVPFLNTTCSSTCLGPTVDFLRCTGNTDIINVTLTATCGKNGTEFCAVLLANLAVDRISHIPNCASNGTCDSSCNNTLTTIVNRLGCCAASWYTNRASSFVSVANQYRTCGVSLGSVCPAAAYATGAGSTIVHLSVMLMFVASALAIFIL